MENKKDAGWRKGGKSREREICQFRQCSGDDEEEKGREGEEMTGKIYLEKVRRHKACRKKRKVKRKESWPRC